MSEARVLDASALLCLVLNEPGAEMVRGMLPGVAISAVNLSEVATKLAEHAMPLEAIERMMGSFGLRVEPFTERLAFQAAALRMPTRAYGLSLGDRACLATAGSLNGSAVTADRAWLKAAAAIGVEVELIR